MPTSASPSPSPAGTWGCVTSAPQGQCSYPGYGQVPSDPFTGAPYVGNNEWGPIAGETQTLYANSPGDWQVTSSTPAGNTSVTTFPNAGQGYGEEPLADFTALTSAFSESFPHSGGTSAWAAFDNWFDNWAHEEMIQYDWYNRGSCTPAASGVQFGGSGGVPVQSWDLCVFGSEDVWTLDASGTAGGEQSGSVDILAMTRWLFAHGYLGSTAPTVTALSMGWEICSTGGVPETFSVSGFSITAAS